MYFVSTFGIISWLLTIVSGSIANPIVFEFTISKTWLDFWGKACNIAKHAAIEVVLETYRVKINIEAINYEQKTFLEDFMPKHSHNIISSLNHSLSRQIFKNGILSETSWPEFDVHPFTIDLLAVQSPSIKHLILTDSKLFPLIEKILPSMTSLTHLSLNNEAIEILMSTNITFQSLQHLELQSLPQDFENLKIFFKRHLNTLTGLDVNITSTEKLTSSIFYQSGLMVDEITVSGNWENLHIDDISAIRDLKTFNEAKIKPFRLDEFITLKSGTQSFQRYVLGKQIGKGDFGIVRLAKRSSDGKIVAIKKSHPSTDKYLIKEASFLYLLNHPNIVAYEESFRYAENFYLVMEYFNGQPLTTLLEKKSKTPIIPQDLVQKILYQFISGMIHFHQEGIVHLDIKPDNILINSNNEIKIIDFGCSEIDSEDNEPLAGDVGNLGSKAPEVLKGTYSIKSDIWSVGALVFELLLNQKAFESEKETICYCMRRGGFQLEKLSKSCEDVKDIYCGDKEKYVYIHLIFENYHHKLKQYNWALPEIISFVDVCMQSNPTDRPTASELLQHPLFKIEQKKEENNEKFDYVQ